MSLAKRFLNVWLRLTEKPFLARVTSPTALRRSFELKAKLAFHAPRGSKFRRSVSNDIPILRVNEAANTPLILYLHGGAFVMGSARSYRALATQISRRTALPVWVPEYRLAPENPFPAAIDDALAVYQAVMDRPHGVIIGGDSAGGGMSLALQAEVIRRGWPMPLGCFAFSPVTDLTFSGDSVCRNSHSDVVLPAHRAKESALLYLQGQDARAPLASPLFANFVGSRPIWLTVGDTEILLDDTRRMAMQLREQGVDVTEVIEQDLPHVWPLFHNRLPEARQTLDDLADWIKDLCPPSADS